MSSPLKSVVSFDAGYELGEFQSSLKPRTDKNQVQLSLGKLFLELKSLLSRDTLNVYDQSKIETCLI